jgi:c-di-GMP-binding flagellar brake protein YcgR
VIVYFPGAEMWSTDERRKHSRCSYFLDIEYMLNPQTTDEIFKCAVVNISSCGMSLLIRNLYQIGQRITIRGELPNLAKTAVVRWTKKIGGCYKVGVECDAENGLNS